MEANNFIAKIKANGTSKDVCDLTQVYDEYKTILSDLGSKDRSPFSLNVLCILCRNLDKVPSWRDKVDAKALLTLSIDCVRETRTSARPDQVKTLACIYHIHKYMVKLSSSVPPELVLKLSFMPFECDSTALLNEYCKTYWNILADRMSYIEKLKTKNSILKLLPRLTEDLIKVMKMYDTVQFCGTVLTFLVKKLHYLYNDAHRDLQKCYGEIFKELQGKIEGESFEKLKEKECVDLYVKFCDCFYVIAENASKNHFKGSVLANVVETATSMFKHNVGLSKCLQTFYSNGFCKIFENVSDDLNVKVLNHLLSSCISYEKEYEQAMKATCPFLNQFVRLYVEYGVANEKSWKDTFNVETQQVCLNLMLYLSTKKGEQQLKCDNCKVKSSLHDSLRLLFLIKYFPSLSITQNMDIKPILPAYCKLVTLQHRILQELRTMGCANHEKCFRKLQTDIHNTAIVLNKASYYETSIKLFHLYVEQEIKYIKSETDYKNIARALYNKSICELDFKLYVEAIKDAFLSLIFSLPDGLKTDKYMSLVMDIKAKQLKTECDNEDGSHDAFQLISVVEACKFLLDDKKYGNLKPFFSHLKFSELLTHEFSMYARLWPSIVPIAGVWRSLNDLLKNKHESWIKAENEEDILTTLFEVVLETPAVVRTIHSEYYSEIVAELVERFDKTPPETIDQRFIQAALLILQGEYDMAEASQKYGWKPAEPTMDPDQFQAVRTFPQEHEALKRTKQAVRVLIQAVTDIGDGPPPKVVTLCLPLYQVGACRQQRTWLAPLALLCLRLHTRDCGSDSYYQMASIILSLADQPSKEVSAILNRGIELWGDDCGQQALVFLCCAAIYYNKCGSTGVGARLLQLVQAKILNAYEKNPDVNLDLAVGRLLEAQNELCRATAGGTLSAISNAQRHYLAVPNSATKHLPRRFTSLHLHHRTTHASTLTAHAWASVGLQRRARAAAGAALGRAGAGAQGALYALLAWEDGQTKIDNRLKHILGLQPSNETQEHKSNPEKPVLLTPRLEQLETMLENVVFKKTQTSPSLPCTSVFAYKMPDFFRHTNCDCYACDNPYVIILSCLTSGIEAATYFRAKEMDIAKNYFEGTIKSFAYAETQLKRYFKKYREEFKSFITDMVERKVQNDFKNVQIEVLIQAAMFELAQMQYDKADDLIVRIHDLMQETKEIDPYLKNEAMNLIITSAQLRKVVKKPAEVSLEVEMENLKINCGEEPKTPEAKLKEPPKITKIVVGNDELPNVKRKVIKLNLDDAQEEIEVKKSVRKRAEFKIPVPVTSKPVIESITPRTRSKPDILITKPTDDVKNTPNVEKVEFSTPISTPAEQFFTPMTSVKTYSKKSLRANIVKNLEAEFSTPKAEKVSTSKSEKEKIDIPKSSRSTRSNIAEKKSLRRATSPGKLVKEAKTTRSRLKKPTNFNIHED